LNPKRCPPDNFSGIFLYFLSFFYKKFEIFAQNRQKPAVRIARTEKGPDYS